MIKLDPAGLAYLAGFFDGEGCIGVYPAGSSYHLLVQLTQNESTLACELLEKVRAEWGGRIARSRSSSGRIKLGYQVGSSQAAELLLDLLPYLRLKRDQAWLSVAWQSRRSRWNTRDERGRLAPRPTVDRDFDAKVVRLVRALKSQDIDQVMDDQRDLVGVQHVLRQVLNYKG